MAVVNGKSIADDRIRCDCARILRRRRHAWKTDTFARSVAAERVLETENRMDDGLFYICSASERVLVEVSRCLTRKIAEGPPSKKTNKKRPLRARRTRFTTLTSSLTALGIAGPRASIYFFFSFFFLYSSSLLLLFTLSASAFVAARFEDSSCDEFVKSSRNYFVRFDTFLAMCMLISPVNRTNETLKIDRLYNEETMRRSRKNEKCNEVAETK